MTREETKKAAETMLAHAEGKEIEILVYDYNGRKEWGDCKNPDWNWDSHDYRIKPQQVSIPATEEELERINRKTVWIKNKRNPDCMGHVLANDKIIDENWFVFNPETKCWEDWGNEK